MPLIARNPAILAIISGTVAQVAMVVVGHRNTTVMKLFAVGGMGISLVAGLLYATLAHSPSAGEAALGGAIAGAVCALIGIFVSYTLGDVPVTLLALGTLSSAVTGAIGGLVGRLIA